MNILVLLEKEISEAAQNELKEEKLEFLGMLLGTSLASLLGNMLVGKGINKTEQVMDLKTRIFNTASSFN